MQKNGYTNLERTLKGSYQHKDTGVSAIIKKLPGVAKITVCHSDGSLWDQVYVQNFGYTTYGIMIGMIKACNDGKEKYEGNTYKNNKIWR
jgi:hypothetical protein